MMNLLHVLARGCCREICRVPLSHVQLCGRVRAHLELNYGHILMTV